jgi:hypothetical protein
VGYEITVHVTTGGGRTTQDGELRRKEGHGPGINHRIAMQLISVPFIAAGQGKPNQIMTK